MFNKARIKISNILKYVATLSCEIQTFKNDTKYMYAKITTKFNCVKVSHTFNQLLILSQTLLAISSFNLHASSQMRPPLVILLPEKFFIFYQDSGLTHRTPDTV